MTNGSLIKTNRFCRSGELHQQIGETMPTFPSENFEEISVADALAHPDFNPALRSLLFQIDTRADTLTLVEIAATLGLDARAVALRLANELIIAEVQRINELDRARQRGLN